MYVSEYVHHGSEVEPGTFGSPFMFTGEMTDDNDLVYLRARYCAPELGVFTGLDPVENLNRYQYVGANPTNHTDPSGWQDEETRYCYSECWNRHANGYYSEYLDCLSRCLQLWMNEPARERRASEAKKDALAACANGLPMGECEIIDKYAEQWLKTASEINVPNITGMNNEAFAAMLGGKIIFEDVRGKGATLSGVAAGIPALGTAWEAINPVLCKGFGVCSETGAQYGEISYGPANIPADQAVMAATWWQTAAPELGLDVNSLRTDYYEGDVHVLVPGYGGGYWHRAIYSVYVELESWDDSGGSWDRWLAVMLLQSARRAQTFRSRNSDVSCWGNPRNEGDPTSAYIIALGVDAYTLSDRDLYDLSEWKFKGGHFSWVEGMKGVRDNGGHLHNWLWNADFTPWTEQEDDVLRTLPY